MVLPETMLPSQAHARQEVLSREESTGSAMPYSRPAALANLSSSSMALSPSWPMSRE